MPYFITWIENDIKKTVSIQELNETKYLIDKNIHKFEVEYFEYTRPKYNGFINSIEIPKGY